MAMAATNVCSSSFSRNISAGLKCGPNGTIFVSTEIRDLDSEDPRWCGYPLGSIVMVMEDHEAPHHMDLLRTFMSQGLVNSHPLLYASPPKDPRGFLGAFPNPSSSKEDKLTAPDSDQISDRYVDGFKCSPSYPCLPQKDYKHMADTVFSIEAIPDADKELEKLLTGYNINGFLNIHEVARINTQVPIILEAKTFSMSLKKRRYLAPKCLNKAPVDGSSGTSYATTRSCSESSKSRASVDY